MEGRRLLLTLLSLAAATAFIAISLKKSERYRTGGRAAYAYGQGVDVNPARRRSDPFDLCDPENLEDCLLS
jgi:hypothetical protein